MKKKNIHPLKEFEKLALMFIIFFMVIISISTIKNHQYT